MYSKRILWDKIMICHQKRTRVVFGAGRQDIWGLWLFYLISGGGEGGEREKGGSQETFVELEDAIHKAERTQVKNLVEISRKFFILYT